MTDAMAAPSDSSPDTVPESTPSPPDAPPGADATASSDAPAMSDVDKIKAAHAARRSRRARPPRPPSSSIIPPPIDASSAVSASDAPPSSADGSSAANGDSSTTEADERAREVATLRVEMASLRRNHLENIKKVSEERDMFASQLAKEQSTVSATTTTTKKLADLEAQLRAARTRNNDLEDENAALRNEVKQLNFRVQASKALDAASDGYNKVVDELVDAKLKCALLLEEKEDLLRINKELTTTSAVLRDANGELEKSRSQWVLDCAKVEKERKELEERLKSQQGPSHPHTNEDTSYMGSDLQELKL